MMEFYNMPVVFNKTGNGLTNVIIGSDEFKSVSRSLFFSEIRLYISTVG